MTYRTEPQSSSTASSTSKRAVDRLPLFRTEFPPVDCPSLVSRNVTSIRTNCVGTHIQRKCTPENASTTRFFPRRRYITVVIILLSTNAPSSHLFSVFVVSAIGDSVRRRLSGPAAAMGVELRLDGYTWASLDLT